MTNLSNKTDSEIDALVAEAQGIKRGWDYSPTTEDWGGKAQCFDLIEKFIDVLDIEINGHGALISVSTEPVFVTNLQRAICEAVILSARGGEMKQQKPKPVDVTEEEFNAFIEGKNFREHTVMITTPSMRVFDDEDNNRVADYREWGTDSEGKVTDKCDFRIWR